MEHQETKEEKIARFKRLIREREKAKKNLYKHIREITLDLADFKRRILDIKRGTW